MPDIKPVASQETWQIICQTLVSWLHDDQPQPPDWPADWWPLLSYAIRVHGVAPQLQLRLNGAPWLPEETVSWLADQYTFNQQRLQRMHEELATIMAAFAHESIPLLLLKGAVLTSCYYETPGLRPMSDLDLLVKPSDFEKALAVMQDIGYEPATINWKHAEFSLPGNQTIVFWEGEHPDNPRKVDLHMVCQEMFSGPRFNITEQMWATAVPQTILGHSVYGPDIDMLWLHLLAHTSGNIWGGTLRLQNLVDIALIAPYIKDGRYLLQFDTRFIYFALVQVQKLFPQAVDHIPVEEIADTIPPALRRCAEAYNLVNASHLRTRPLHPHTTKIMAFTRGRPSDLWAAAKFILLPTPQEYQLGQTASPHKVVAWAKHLGSKANLIFNLLKADYADKS